MVPNQLWELKEVDQYSKVIWCYIYSQREDWASSRNNLARNLNMSVNTVTRHVESLEKLGMLVVDRTHEAWSFTPLPPTNWISHCSGSDLIQITQCSTTESLSDPVPDQPVIHTKDSILNSSSKNSSFDNSRLLKNIDEILGSKMPLDEFETKLVNNLKVQFKYKPASTKQAELLELIYSRIPKQESVVLPIGNKKSIISTFTQPKIDFAGIKANLSMYSWIEDYSSSILKAAIAYEVNLTNSQMIELQDLVSGV